ncbi:hypothetical protein BU24DRAFT_425258 [Aaosphaeria arxii CBS 175.79]|uniref:Uncharacterized protein n=1 Tax=Aaosphaeria arxii CBS 175.79 TaxID=1450172 RepID=A0A6A5XI40_9PLEO|nr:uncharacterized protein BU24DRAFT_425258 [Aaosphaeria arxii CBS 175.79]KAF2012623.1 hypothetical protein BU24DRAFT_425258 [Aaosphaeria arxii CBS 175.79]
MLLNANPCGVFSATFMMLACFLAASLIILGVGFWANTLEELAAAVGLLLLSSVFSSDQADDARICCSFCSRSAS